MGLLAQRLEDNFEDILGKAISGLGESIEQVAEKSCVPVGAIKGLLSGILDREMLVKVAESLSLNPKALLEIVDGWVPQVEPVAGLVHYTTPFPVPGYAEMTVNAYLYFDTESREAVIIDTGADACRILEDIERHALSVVGVYLTHAHRDHVAALGQLQAALPKVPFWIDGQERISGVQLLEDGERHCFKALSVESRSTPGHSPGGRTFVVSKTCADSCAEDAPSRGKVAFVGDALFAGSVGGARKAYTVALEAIETQILSLPAGTLLCPGHGPMTSVAAERRHNPFFARDIRESQ